MSIKLFSNRTPSDMGPMNEGCPSITPYLLEGDGPFPVVIICPGGAYVSRADHEGEPVAKWLNSIGVSAIVLNYRVAPYQYPASLEDAKRAIRMARHHANEWKLDPNRLAILGFSAGGHLASTAGTHYDGGTPHAEDPIERHSSRPDLMVLCYPVITMGEFSHETSKLSLLGNQPKHEISEHLSNETQVQAGTPPAFIWHTADDGSVPAENSLLFAGALSKHHVPYELHVFESGVHGLGLAEEHQEAKEWTRLCEAWFKAKKFIAV